MLSRFFDDPARIAKKLDESTFQGRYMLNAPGNGVQMPFQEDPQLRLQGWGANLSHNAITIESDLRGLTRPLTRDHVELNNHDIHKEVFAPYIYPSANPFVEESRATHPAWMYRGLEHYRWEKPWLNPQNNIERPFHHNVQTRILEKNAYMMKHY